MANQTKITYGQLHRLLLDLGFVDTTVNPESSTCQTFKTYRQATTDTLILLPNRRLTATPRDADLVSVRRHLVENGLIDESELENLLSAAA